MVHSSEHKPPPAETNVVVIGGGPGGCAAAIQCASSGLNVTLVEREPFPRDRPGETLHPGVEPLLEQLGVLESVHAAGFLRHEGNWVRWDGTSRFEPFGADEHDRWRGYQAWRADFDTILLDRARELGVRVIQPCRAERAMLDGTRVCGVRTSAGEIASAFVVDATGDRHWLAGQLDLQFGRRSPRLIARYGYVRGACPGRDEAPALVADSNGWTWTARVKPNLYQWTRLALSGETREESSQGPPAEFERLESCGRARGADVTWRAVTRPAGAGYFIVGDAAAVLDPASSHGVLKALMTGMMAAHSIRQIVECADERFVTEAYGRWVHDWFEHDVSKLKELYAIFKQPTGDAEREPGPRRFF
jgi:flavin-dependent dehydrogenase